LSTLETEVETFLGSLLERGNSTSARSEYLLENRSFVSKIFSFSLILIVRINMNFGSTIGIRCFFNVSDFCNRLCAPDVLRRGCALLFLMIVVTANSHFIEKKKKIFD